MADENANDHLNAEVEALRNALTRISGIADRAVSQYQYGAIKRIADQALTAEQSPPPATA